MIEYEVKTGQTVESIENTRRERCQMVMLKNSNDSCLKERLLRKRKRETRPPSPLKTPNGSDEIQLSDISLKGNSQKKEIKNSGKKTHEQEREISELRFENSPRGIMLILL